MASVTSSGTGTFMRADVVATYKSLGSQTGALGYPLGKQSSISDPNGNGVVEAFEAGTIHASDRGAFAISNNVMKAYSAAGWLRGSLGWPTTASPCGPTSCTQGFAGGTIRAALDGTRTIVVVSVDPLIDAAYLAAGGETGPLGFAIAKSGTVTDKNGNGVVQAFEGGYVHAGPKGAFAVTTNFMSVVQREWLAPRCVGMAGRCDHVPHSAARRRLRVERL